LHITTIAVTCFAQGLLARKATDAALWASTWLVWGALGVTAAIVAPGASYLFIVPTIVAGLAAFGAGSRVGMLLSIVAPALAAALLWLPLVVPLQHAFGFAVPAVASAPAAVALSTLAPLRSSPRWVLAGLGAFGLGLAVVAAFLPPFSAAHPQRVNVSFTEEGGHAKVGVHATWGAFPWGRPPAPMLAALGKSGGGWGTEQPLPWEPPGPTAETTAVDDAAPVVDVLSSKEGGTLWCSAQVVVHIRPAAGSALVLQPTPDAGMPETLFKVDGHVATTRRGLLLVRNVPKDGITLEMTSRCNERIETLSVYEGSYGLPPGSLAASVAAARPATAVASQDGDLTIRVTRVNLR
jgi:hypothetical protein